MKLIVILLVLAIQRYLNNTGRDYCHKVLKAYVGFVQSKLSSILSGNAWVAALVLVLPLVIVMIIVSSLMFNLSPRIGFFIFSALILWLCLDARDQAKVANDATTSKDCLVYSCNYLYGPLLWYLLLGMVGLLIYTMINYCLRSESTLTEQDKLHHLLVLARATLDWIPVRLLALSFALVGSFGAVFSTWLLQLFRLPSIGYSFLQNCAYSALGHKDEGTHQKVELSSVFGLLDRSLIIWLLVLAVVVMSHLLG